MNTHIPTLKKALRVGILMVSCLGFFQAEIALAQERPMPESAQRYLNEGAGGGGENKGEGTPLKIDKKNETDLLLLQPLDDSTKTLQAKPGIQIFFDYFNLSWPWVLGVCAGLAVLQAMVGGMQMMSSNYYDAGKERMTWAIAGLLIIALSGMILTTINPLFYS